MADINDLLTSLFNGGSTASASPAAPAASGVQDSGVRALNNSVAQANVLARLKVPGSAALSGIGGAAGAGMSAVKPDSSMFGAFAQGIGGGMKAAADQKAAQAKATLELMKAQWDHEDKLANRKNQADTLAETVNAHKALAKYYEGMVENGARDKTDVVNDAYKTELARTNAANRMGLRDPTLNKALSDPMALPEQKAAAQAELDRRQKMFDEWDSKQTWSKDGKLPAPGSLPALPPQDPNMPVAPGAGGDDEGDNPTPTPATPAPGTQPGGPAAPMAQETLRPVTGPNGEKMLWGPKSGFVPFNDGQAAAAVGTPPPPGMTAPDDAIPGFSG